MAVGGLLRRNLIVPDNVDEAFDAACIAAIAESAGAQDGADVERFGENVRAAVQGYLERAQAPTDAEVRSEILALRRAAATAERAMRGTLAAEYSLDRIEQFIADDDRPLATWLKKIGAGDAKQIHDAIENLRHRLAGLSDAARLWIEMPGPRLPPAAALRETRQQAFDAITLTAGMTVRSAKPTGKKRVRLVPTPVGPHAGTRAGKLRAGGRQRHVDGIVLAAFLAVAYYELTGRLPSRWRSGSRPGPFVRMVEEVLVAMRAAGSVGADDLVRRYLALRRRGDEGDKQAGTAVQSGV